MGPWYRVAAPGGTPEEIIDELSAEVAKILPMPDVREALESQGMRPLISTPEQFAAHVRSEMVRSAKIVKAGNVRIE